jgi:hypothetical protein
MGSGGGGFFAPMDNYNNPNYGGGNNYGGGQGQGSGSQATQNTPSYGVQAQPNFGGYQGGYQQPSFFGGGQYFNNPYGQPPAPVQRPQYNNPYTKGYGYDRPQQPFQSPTKQGYDRPQQPFQSPTKRQFSNVDPNTQSLNNINKSYAGDYNDYISGGGTESSFIASPTFQDYERDIIDNIGGLSDRDRLNSDLTYQRGRSTEGSLYSPSAGRITSAIERRLDQLGPEVIQAEPLRRGPPKFGNRFMMDNLNRGLGS